VLPKGLGIKILHTCEREGTAGPRITKQAIKFWSAQDEVGVLCFEGARKKWVFELTPARVDKWR